MQPIWKDYFVTLGTGTDPIAYRVSVYENGGWTIIYEGRAYPKPGAIATTPLKVRVNDIYADYFQKHLPLEDLDWWAAEFKLEAYQSGSWVQKDKTYYTRSWSYDVDDDGTLVLPVLPLTTILHPAQYLPIMDDDGIFTAKIYFDDGTSSTFSEDITEEDYWTDFNRRGYWMFLDLEDYPGWVRIEANGNTYTRGKYCGGCVLYYINAYGGWDTLPVQGRVVLSDGITHYTAEKIYDNTTTEARGKDNYVNEVTVKYLLNIGPMSSQDSVHIDQLAASPFVYIDDFDGNHGGLFPVVITTTSEERKDRRGVLHFYQIEATLAQDRTRR